MGKRICPVEGCEGEQRSRGLCGMHYARWRRHGGTTALRAYHAGNPESRFWAKVDKTQGCWNWTAGTVTGYGNHSDANGQHVLAHRFAYELLVGPIPHGMQIDHQCHNRRCVNPDHLRIASNKQNVENHQGPRRDSKSRIRGVAWHGHSKLWRATVMHDGVSTTRYFHDREDAAAAVIAMRNERHSFNDRDRLGPILSFVATS